MTLDAVVVGAGPNGLAAAITLARAGRSVEVFEAAPTPGGGARSAELTLPGFVHDVCSSVHPLAVGSPFFRSVDLAAHGVEWVEPDAQLAHPLDDGRVAFLERSVEATAAGLGRDAARWRRLMGPLAADLDKLLPAILGPVVRVPRHPIALVRFGLPALLPATALARLAFRTDPARALFGGMAAHSMLRLDALASASFGLVLGLLGQTVGWPVARGGSGTIVTALVDELTALGGVVHTDHAIASLDDLPQARAILLDTTPTAALSIAGRRIGPVRRWFARRFRYGPGVFKLDLALDGPLPWRTGEVARAATVHLGGALPELAASEAAVAEGRLPERPFVLLVQASLFDRTRAPDDGQTVWAYCHVPRGFEGDATAVIEAQIERFAPGFRDRVIGRRSTGPAELEAYDANYVGGDINAGLADLRQLILRPWPALDPYRLGRGLFLCSSSTPPGGGVHGMSGWHAAQSALRHELRHAR
ncbi:MAG TPA: NAD(P)/FAD-dependent oxidoreductase [Candidatus Limnocylindrales bacterium]|nr:NAD(P)/FAD-dependent oxidoreductase [Candidatus Limnocylindrales bacterium]